MKTMMMLVLFSLVLVVSLEVHVDAMKRDDFMPTVLDTETNHPSLEEPLSLHEPTDEFENEDLRLEGVSSKLVCNLCLAVSKQAVKFISNCSLFEELENLSIKVCGFLPPLLEVQCKIMGKRFVKQTKSFLQKIFDEEYLCNSTGLCPNKDVTLLLSTSSENELDPALLLILRKHLLMVASSQFLAKEELITMNKAILEYEERKTCASCRNTVSKIHNTLEDSSKQVAILKDLLNACEAAEGFANQCKTLVLEYGPLILGGIRKFFSINDLCHVIQLCKYPLPPPDKNI